MTPDATLPGFVGSSGDGAPHSAPPQGTRRLPLAFEGQRPPPWILETQRVGWSGAWEPTPTLSETFSGWVRGFVGKDLEPPPFAAAEERTGGALDAPDEAARDPEVLERLRRLLYPEGSGPAEYVPWADETTDDEGWTYASRPERLAEHRPGGRAGQRYGDRYRRRWWTAAVSTSPAITRASSWRVDTVALGDSSPKLLACPQEARERAFESLSQALRAVFSNRGFHEVPLDPVSYVRRLRADAAWYEALCSRLQPWTDIGALGELSVAALYMRAAYGYCARMGMFDSVTTGAMVFSVQKAAFDVSEDVDDASNTHSFVDMLGLSVADLVRTRWKAEGPFQPAYIIARDHAMKWIVVAVRGTLSMKDILTDMAAHHVPFLEGQAHEGFAHATEQLLAASTDELQAELAAHPGYRLVFCGHSMGGAVAAMAAARLRHEATWAEGCVAFGIGTPSVMSRCIGERLARERAVFTAVNGRDWSPRFSMSNVNAMLDHLCELSILRSAMRVATSSEIPLPHVDDPQTEQLPAGVILQIAPPAANGSAEGCTGGPRLLAARAEDYRHAMPVWPDVDAHIPIGYLRGLLPGLAAAVRGGAQWLPQRAGEAAAGGLGGAAQGGAASERPVVEGSLGDFLCSVPAEAVSAGSAAAAAAAICGAPVLAALRRVAGAGQAPEPPPPGGGAPRAEVAAAAGTAALTPVPPGAAAMRAGQLPARPDAGRQLVAECLGALASLGL